MKDIDLLCMICMCAFVVWFVYFEKDDGERHKWLRYRLIQHLVCHLSPSREIVIHTCSPAPNITVAKVHHYNHNKNTKLTHCLPYHCLWRVVANPSYPVRLIHLGGHFREGWEIYQERIHPRMECRYHCSYLRCEQTTSCNRRRCWVSSERKHLRHPTIPLKLI